MSGGAMKKALWKNWYLSPRLDRFLVLTLGCG